MIIGFFEKVRPLLKPDTSATALRRAIGAYIHSKRYNLACAQPDSMRHDLDGKAVEPLSEAHRLNAQAYVSASKRKPGAPAVSDDVPIPSLDASSKRDLIRASLLGGFRKTMSETD